MISVERFEMNPFLENTYVLSDESGDCMIIDPGCHNRQEQDALVNFIRDSKLQPVLLLNTHCHIDHVLGNKFVQDMYGLLPLYHRREAPILEAMVAYAESMHLPYDPSSPAESFLEAGKAVKFGNSSLDCLFTPGHSPGSLSFFSPEERFVIGGDVLFQGSIGRTDLPGGNFDTLINSIKTQLFPLGDDVLVYPGHGAPTRIGFEREHNPFL